ncbi:MAG TPA: Hsp70 family protein, partial [Pseudonocardiaceae bacterium]|nr:Hsp70 family protein [Pseudonocardiaceae bacterium]
MLIAELGQALIADLLDATASGRLTSCPSAAMTSKDTNGAPGRLPDARSGMPYGLGIDLGTSCTVAAISRAGAEAVDLQVVALGTDAPGIPTVVHLADDGTLLVGAAAEPLVLTDPDRAFRGFLYHVDEPFPADPERSPAALTARLVRWVVEVVADREGGPAAQITLAHPVVWGPAECRAVQAALNEFGLPDVVLVPVPVAAATAYATQRDPGAQQGTPARGGPENQLGVPVGEAIAVYDLGAAFSASVLRRDSAGFTLLSQPEVIEDGGGARFDEAVLARVLDELGDQLAAFDLEDPAVLSGMAQLLAGCVTAREALDVQAEATIPVSLPDLQAEIRLTADELAALVEPALRATVPALREAITTAQLTPSAIETVVLTGGCARMPQVARLLTAELGRPLAVLPDPELAAA